MFSGVVSHQLGPRKKKRKKKRKYVLHHFHCCSHQLFTTKPNSQTVSQLLAKAPCRTGKDNNKISFYTHRQPAFHLHWETECCRHGHASLWHSISGKITISCCFTGIKTPLQPMKTLFCKKKKKYEPDRLSWPANTAKYKSSLLCLHASCKAWNTRQEITEGICQQCSWLGSINVHLACFSTQTLETNSSPIHGSCLDKRWWIPGAEAANRDFLPPLLYIYILYSLKLFHFAALVSQLHIRFSFQK